MLAHAHLRRDLSRIGGAVGFLSMLTSYKTPIIQFITKPRMDADLFVLIIFQSVSNK